MKYAILGDVHGNWEALCAVLRDAQSRGVNAWACVGDIVGYNADPGACLARIRELGCIAVQGNHDHFAVHAPAPDDLSDAAAAALEWTRARLSPGECEALLALPRTAQAEDFTLVHNTLEPSDGWPYVFDVADAARSLRRQSTPLCFCGHTHVPAAFERRNGVALALSGPLVLREGSRFLINVGSVGQPRDRDPRAAYVLYDTTPREIQVVRVSYDVSATQDKIRKAGLPLWLALRLSFGM